MGQGTRRRRRAVALAVCALAACAPTASASGIEVHAHRGGPLDEGRAVAPENALSAFQRAHELGADVIELDAELTADGVPVVIHDATLDRTTTCSGPVRSFTAQRLREECRIDVLGIAPHTEPIAEPSEPVPTLAEALSWAAASGARLNLEIKNIPTEPASFDPTPRFATAVLDAVDASGLPREQVIVQSFWPPNLELAEIRGFETSLLTLGPLNEGAILWGTARFHEWLSPQWPPLDPAGYVRLAHAAGKRVVPFTLDAEAALAAARDAGVDAVISNDPARAARVVRATP